MSNVEKRNDDFKNRKEEESLNYLEKHFVTNDGAENFENFEKVDLSYLNSSNSNEYINIPLELLPCGVFYKNGTKIMIRSAKVQEVQAYSVVDDTDYLDIVEKMNHILSSCIKFTYPNGNQGSYKDVKDADRIFLIFMIRELTFPGGKNLSKEATCEHCGHEFKIELRATSSEKVNKSFVNYEMPAKLNKFFDSQEKVYKLNINDVEYKLAPPTIGLQENFTNDLREKVYVKKTNPNVAFIKVASFMLYDLTKITDEGKKVKEQEFKKMDMKTFQILNNAVNQMIFGIKELKTACPSCGLEVHTDMSFPTKASEIFVVDVEEYFD